MIKDIALTYSGNYNANVVEHLSKKVFEALKKSVKKCNFVIQKKDKGNWAAIIENDNYLSCMDSYNKNFFQLTMKKILTIIWRTFKNQDISLLNNIRKLK